MKLALLATLVTFAGSLAGFSAATAGSPTAAKAPASSSKAVVVQNSTSGGHDCPWARAARDA